jgi:uncharacterized protein YndB with AHSA1/START domain
MAKAEVTATINRPIEDVFAVLTDPEKTATWSSNAVEEHWTTPGPVAVGSRRRAVTRFLGRRAENEAEVTQLEPNRKWTLRSVSGTPWEVSATFEPVEGGTRVDWIWSFGFGGLLKLLDPLMVGVLRRMSARDLARLKDMMERGAL